MLFPVFVIESKLLFADKVSILINNKKRWRRNMPKGKTIVFFCQECGYESSKWMGQCPACKEWNTFVEEMIDKKSAAKGGRVAAKAAEAKTVPLSQIEMTQDKRMSTDMKELDRVLGGGIVQGSLVLVGGHVKYSYSKCFL